MSSKKQIPKEEYDNLIAIDNSNQTIKNIDSTSNSNLPLNNRKETENSKISNYVSNNTKRSKCEIVYTSTSDCFDNEIQGKYKSKENLKEEVKSIIQECLLRKSQGNDYFKSKQYSKALNYYQSSLSFLNKMKPECELVFNQSNFFNIKVECLNNIAICFLVKSEYSKAIHFTDLALNIQRQNYRSLYIKYKALKKSNQLESAIEVIKKVSIYMLFL